jgi:hypothetical protein
MKGRSVDNLTLALRCRRVASIQSENKTPRPNRLLKSEHGWVEELLRGLGSKYRERWIYEQADLLEH